MTKWRKCSLCDKREDTEVNGEIVSFHRFPTNPDKRNIWLALIGIESVPRKTLMLCSDHFDPSHFFYTNRGSRKLRPDATPMPFLPSTSANRNNSVGLLPVTTTPSDEYTQIKIENNDHTDIDVEYNKLIPISGGNEIPMDFPSFVKVEKDQPEQPHHDKIKVEIEDMDFLSCATNSEIKVDCDQSSVTKIKLETDLWTKTSYAYLTDNAINGEGSQIPNDAHTDSTLGSDPNECTKIKVDEDEIQRFLIDTNNSNEGTIEQNVDNQRSDICTGSDKELSKAREERVGSDHYGTSNMIESMYHIPKLTGIELEKLRPEDFEDTRLAEYYLTSMNAELNRNTDEIEVLEGVVKSLRLKVKSLLSLHRELREKSLINERKKASIKASFRNTCHIKLNEQKMDALLDDICNSDDRIELVKE